MMREIYHTTTSKSHISNQILTHIASMNCFVFACKLREPDSGKQDSATTDRQPTGSNNISETEKISNIAELHLNIWKVNCSLVSSDIQMYFDFGLKIHNTVKSIYVYIPFEFNKDECQYDLVGILQDKNQLLCAVFNSDLKTENTQGDHLSLVKDKNNKSLFQLCKLGHSKFDTIKISDGKRNIGAILKINTNGLDNRNTKYTYIRFRLKPKTIRDVIKTEHISNDFLQAAFSKIDMFDFRVNETRDINPEVMDKINTEGYTLFRFEKIHLFFMADSKEKVENGSSIKIDSRLLESDIWSDYIPLGSRKCSYIAHHWKKRQKRIDYQIKDSKITQAVSYTPFDDYRIFFTSTYPRLQPLRLFIYLFSVILIGWSASMLSFNCDGSYSTTELLKIAIISFMLLFVILFLIFVNFGLKITLFRK